MDTDVRMSAAFTPGPWEQRSREAFGDDEIAIEPMDANVNDGRVIALCYGSDRSHNARLIAAAPDHALVGWAMCVQDATWEEWGDNKGEFCFAGLRHATSLDEFGCPVLTDHLRTLIVDARAHD